MALRGLAIAALSAVCALSALAHPMGNFSVSHYARLEPRTGHLTIVYALDLAEIPTFEASRDWNLDAKASNGELAEHAKTQMAAWSKNLQVSVNGIRLALRSGPVDAVVSEGAGGMPVVRVTARLTAPLPEGSMRLSYEDPNFAGRAGWKEIVVRPGPGIRLTEGSETKDVSLALTAYPEEASYVPPQQTKVALAWVADAPPAVSRISSPTAATAPPSEPLKPVSPAGGPLQTAPGVVIRGDYLSTLLSRQELPWTLMLSGLLAAFGLGAMHALSPGHGKTLVAAYLVGSRGTIRHAAFLGATVTFTHTVSVFFLGLVTLFLSRYILPEKIVPWLGAISGCSIILLGLSLLKKRWARLMGKGHSHSHAHGAHPHHHHDHSHGHDYDHDHAHDHGHDHGDGHHHHHVPQGEITFASLIALGVSGGLVPCPTALVLLLSAIAIGRTAFGLALLVAFSLGLALVLVAIGALVLYAKTLLPSSSRLASSPAFKLVPVFSAAVIVGLGILMTGASIGVFKPIG